MTRITTINILIYFAFFTFCCLLPKAHSKAQDTVQVSGNKTVSQEQIDKLNRQCVEYYYNDRKLALKIAFEALELSESIGYTKGVGVALNSIGNIYLFTGEYDMALISFLDAIKSFKLINFNDGIIICGNNIGVIYEHQGKYEDRKSVV